MKKIPIIALAALALAGCAGNGSSHQAPAYNGAYVFTSTRDGVAEVYMGNLNHPEVTRLTFTQTGEGAGPVSPDRTKILFISQRDGNPEIYSMNMDGSNPVNLSQDAGDDSYPAWTPDGKIVFDSNRTGHYQLHVMNADGTNKANLTNSQTDDVTPNVSPDGTKIVYTSVGMIGDLQTAHVVTMDRDGTNKVVIPNTEAGIFPTFSPDGLKIAYDKYSEGVNIWTIDPDGTDAQALTTGQAFSGYQCWTPDGSKIVFARTQSGEFQICTMDPDGTHLAIVSTTEFSDYQPFCVPASTH